MKKFLKNAYFSLNKIKISNFRKNRKKLGLLIRQGMLKCIHVCLRKCLRYTSECPVQILKECLLKRTEEV